MNTQSILFPWLVGGAAAGVVLLLVWSMVWKALALWHSAKRGQKVWFVILFLVNTAGLLEIIYLFTVAKIQKKK